MYYINYYIVITFEFPLRPTKKVYLENLQNHL